MIRDKKNNQAVTVPCGKCEKCYKRRVSAWSFRLLQEDKHSQTSYFITLTYDTDHVNFTNRGYLNLCKRDFQLFIKRVRKSHDIRSRKSSLLSQARNTQLKYYAVGEYGGKRYRPHFHCIVFNASLELMFDKPTCRLLRDTKYDGKTQVICKQWPLGMATVGQVTGASVGYTLKYMMKQSRIPMHKNDDRTPEFALMSKGLGERYLTPAMKQWHKADLVNRMYCNAPGGVKISMPRYYKLKLYDDTEKALVKVHFDQEFQKKVKAVQDGRVKVNYKAKHEAHLAAKSRLRYNQSVNQKF